MQRKYVAVPSSCSTNFSKLRFKRTNECVVAPQMSKVEVWQCCHKLRESPCICIWEFVYGVNLQSFITLKLCNRILYNNFYKGISNKFSKKIASSNINVIDLDDQCLEHLKIYAKVFAHQLQTVNFRGITCLQIHPI